MELLSFYQSWIGLKFCSFINLPCITQLRLFQISIAWHPIWYLPGWTNNLLSWLWWCFLISCGPCKPRQNYYCLGPPHSSWCGPIRHFQISHFQISPDKPWSCHRLNSQHTSHQVKIFFWLVNVKQLVWGGLNVAF